ncbi:FAD-linked oxidoreductase-like protein [Mycena crocata]|nr:FAD-linked oxidoreductase-like protein [Mycena crocata]
MLRLSRTTLPKARFSRPHAVRYASSRPPRSHFTRWASGGVALGLGGALLTSTLYADSAAATMGYPRSNRAEEKEEGIRSSFGTLVRTYLVYTMCSIPTLVDSAPWLLDTFTSIPGLRWITEAIVRVTFFDQFVGGDSAAETLPLLQALRSANTGTLFAYSVEVDEAEAMAASRSRSLHDHKSPHNAIVEEMLHCIDVAADFEDGMGATQTGRRTWVAVKITALLPDASALIRLSSDILATRAPSTPPDVVFPGNPTATDLDVLYAPGGSSKGSLSPADLTALCTLHSDLERICARAQARGVRIIIDAEYTWYQPALDALALALMRRFNALNETQTQTQPLIYATFQAYLRRTPAHLAHAMRDAQKHGYALGVKLVRGAYHTHEIAAHPGITPNVTAHPAEKTLSISPDVLPPVWADKRDTDAAYDACAAVLLDVVRADVVRAESSSSWNIGGGGKTRSPDAQPHIGVLFGTHNWASCGKLLEGMEERGLATSGRVGGREGKEKGEGEVIGPAARLRVPAQVGERVTFGQLYGMCDDLTQYLANRMESGAPMVIKYVPYGALADVMPYLSRRAIENKSVLGGGAAQAERARAGRLIWERVVGVFGW